MTADLYAAYAAELRAYARRLGATPEDAEDVVQTAFVKMLSSSYQERGMARAWLYEVVRCRVIDMRRKAAHYPAGSAEPSYDPFERVIDALDAAAAARMLKRLPPNQARALWLHVAEDRSLEDTARTMGRTVGAVKSLCHRARASLTQ